ncbi:MAG: hypothetical protein K0R59_46 [Sphingobacterium sp.]|jgi:hypothetical protein|nr:hypothetical protein [Sphingobacterium sp.]
MNIILYTGLRFRRTSIKICKIFGTIPELNRHYY